LLRRVYLQTMRMTSSVNFPIYTGMAVFAPEMVQFALGPRWLSTVPLLRIFSLWAIMRSTGNPIGGLVMSVGRPGLEFKWNLAWLAIMPPVVWLGSAHGTMGMSYALFAAMACAFVPNWFFLVRPLCGARLGEYTLHALLPLPIAVGAALFGRLCVDSIDNSLARLSIGLLLAALAYLGLSYVFNKSWLRAMAELLRIPLTPGLKLP